MDEQSYMKVRMLAKRICDCIRREKHALFCSRTSSARAVVGNRGMACKVLAYGKKIACSGDVLCRIAVESMSSYNATVVRKKVAYLLSSQFLVVNEHIYGRYPSLLPDYLKDGDVDGYIAHCRNESADISLDAFEDIVVKGQDLLTIISEFSKGKGGNLG